MKVIEILKKRLFWKFNLWALILYVVLFVILTIGLRIYTHHGQVISVPDFTGLRIDRVQELAQNYNFRINIGDSTYVSYLPKGTVIDQHPAPGAAVKKNRTIFITINALTQVKVEMPKVIGYSYRQGKAIIERKGLTIGKLIYKPDYAKNNILNQMYNGVAIKPGQLVDKGAAIDLVLGNGNTESLTTVPDLTGLRLQLAKSEISDAYLNLGKVRYDASVNSVLDSMNAFIYRQWPTNDQLNMVNTGSRVDLWFTLDSTLLPVPEPLNLE